MLNMTKTKTEIENYEQVKSDFSDYTKFEGKKPRRQFEREAFINDIEYTPNFDYPKLDSLIDDESIADKKSKIYEAIMELEAAKNYSEISPEELELYAGCHEVRLKKIMLVEAARDLNSTSSMAGSEINRQTFIELNESIYGTFDKSCYLGLLNTESNNLSGFNPKSEKAIAIKNELNGFYEKIDIDNEYEKPLLCDEDLKKLHDYVESRYENILNVVPDTSDDVYYDVDECAEIMNKALEAGGLSQYGWIAIENSSKTAPSTNQAKTSIFLPSNTCRNSSELRRLIIHEQEVHARRAQNAKSYNVKPLQFGTANYADIEEGLGVIMECAVSGNLENASFDRARNRYLAAGLALGVDSEPRDARETYEVLWRMISIQNSKDGEISDNDINASKNAAYTIVENAFRGTPFWMKGVIYTKLKVYYEGLVKNAKFFEQNIDNLDNTFNNILIGKYDHTNVEELDLIRTIIDSKKERIDDNA